MYHKSARCALVRKEDLRVKEQVAWRARKD